MTKVTKTDQEWQAVLTPEQFNVTRRGGTEAPFSGAYHACTVSGTYCCVCCGRSLFSSRDKFDSGTGWPSFTRAHHAGAVDTRRDLSHAMVRTEVLCAGCDAHLGHVFADGPPPHGQRYCINATALTLEENAAKT